MEAPSGSERARWRRRLGDHSLHRQLLTEVACLHETEGRRPVAPARQLTGWVRVATWNAQRGHRPAEAAALLREDGLDVLLLSELDSGMARTGNADVPGALVAGLGDVHERQGTTGENARGLHGNAVAARTPLGTPSVVRLDDTGRWFGAGSPEPRVGGRMAVLATVELDGVAVRVVSTHLENVTDPAGRAVQFAALVDALGPGPVLIGGDLNTFGTSFDEITDRDLVRQLHAGDPERFLWPVAHEPLFAVAADQGFSWMEANVPTATSTHGPLKLDWLLARGLEARDPVVHGAAGLSDHHVVAATVRLPGRVRT